MVSLALYQPDIPQNMGAALRLGACLGVDIHAIEPAGFDISDRNLRRTGLDYVAQARLVRHRSWDDFLAVRGGRRVVLLTTKSSLPYTGFDFMADDFLLLGRESAGVPDSVHQAADARLTIPMASGLRSLNVVNAAAMVLGEALRQTGGFPVPVGR